MELFLYATDVIGTYSILLSVGIYSMT